jgi:hypothetical protein
MEQNEMMPVKNWNCDGSHCTSSNGEVRIYPLGSGGNLILCHSCFAHENRYRAMRGRDTKRPEDFPHISWASAKRYAATQEKS